jgi:hypothetical protein
MGGLCLKVVAFQDTVLIRGRFVFAGGAIELP